MRVVTNIDSLGEIFHSELLCKHQHVCHDFIKHSYSIEFASCSALTNKLLKTE